ncbi:MAG: 1-deoxy-D-xylulose-5-phosphate synthase [Planctomycetota bacterium]|jgi:1-deoxy-D-xylulose-5-phosphate synthase
MSPLLEKINGPADLDALSVGELAQLGHLASNLGVVEMTIALHRAFDFTKDRLLWDVGHQCYAHKVLTGRRDDFNKLRQEDGLSGFPCPAESEYDLFSVGHAGTSISTALGMALGAQHRKTDEKIVALVGDASIVNGLSFEALNNLCLAKRQLLIVLNDNSMAIDVTQGAMAKFLSKVRLSHTYEDFRKTTNRILEHLPLVGKRMEEDGHDIGSMIELFEALSHLDTPAILHVYTRKGKGYDPADDNPCKYHSTGPFEVNGVSEKATAAKRSFTSAFGDAITAVGETDERVVAITAAMPDGTGLGKFREKFPDRYYDVGIAESVAIDMAAGLAKQGLRPVVCIYSTFLQRGIDQIFQEISLQNLPVTFCIDRAGAVGNDGPTHHGFYDLGYLRMLPNLTVAAPADEYELKAALELATRGDKPFAIRYPKDAVPAIPENNIPVQPGKSVRLRSGNSEFAVITVGPILKEAMAAAEELEKDGIAVTVVNARFVKPLDEDIIELFRQGKTVLLAEDNSTACGFGSAVIEHALQIAEQSQDEMLRNSIGKAVLLGAPDAFIPAAARAKQLGWMRVGAEQIAETVKTLKFGAQKADKSLKA